MSTKRAFLIAYDYGSGGLWGVMLAASEQQITERYPELTVVPERPVWMTKERYADLAATPYDVEDMPWGLLNAVLEDRQQA